MAEPGRLYIQTLWRQAYPYSCIVSQEPLGGTHEGKAQRTFDTPLSLQAKLPVPLFIFCVREGLKHGSGLFFSVLREAQWELQVERTARLRK